MESKINKRTKYKQYGEDAIIAAVEEVKNKTSSLRKIALKYKIPRTTIMNRSKNNETKKQGRKTILNENEEKEIENWLIEWKEKGEKRTRKELLIAAKDTLSLRNDPKAKFQNKLPSIKWLKSFLKRHPRITEEQALINANIRRIKIKKEEDNNLNEAVQNQKEDVQKQINDL